MVKNTIATSTVTSSHTTLGSVTSKVPHLEFWLISNVVFFSDISILVIFTFLSFFFTLVFFSFGVCGASIIITLFFNLVCAFLFYSFDIYHPYSYFQYLLTWFPLYLLPIGQVGRVFANDLGDRGSIPGLVIPKTQKWYFIRPCLALSIIQFLSRVNWSNPEKGVEPYPTHRCRSYWKEKHCVTLDYGHWLYFFTIFIMSRSKNEPFCSIVLAWSTIFGLLS